MDSLLSDNLTRLRHAIWHGDWDDTEKLAGALAAAALPADQQNLTVLLDSLSEILTSAKFSRMELLSSAGRLRAVTGFNSAANGRFLPL